MTDNEIIKALECLCGSALKCRECPYSPRYQFPLRQQQVAKHALDLINRQKAESELWQNEYKRACAERDAHIATTRFIRAEAVKEFAEKIKKHCTSVELNAYIDSLVEEMEEKQWQMS